MEATTGSRCVIAPVRAAAVRAAAIIREIPDPFAPLADLAGLPATGAWQGRSLRSAGDPRSFLYAFECREDRPATVAVLAGQRKLIGLVDQRQRRVLAPLAAFDLGKDPREELDLWARDASWPGDLQEHLERHSGELIEAVIGPSPAQVDQEQRGDLEDLGYGGR